METRCPDCFHPRSGAAACTVCHAARTTPFPFGVSPAGRATKGRPFYFSASRAHPAMPFSFGLSPPTADPFSFGFQPTSTACFGQRRPPPSFSVGTEYTESCLFDDDEPLEMPPAPSLDVGEALVLKTHCESPAVARGSAREGFAVLVHAKATGAASTAGKTPIDLVTVLDVSGRMTGAKLALLKDAMGFIVNSLGLADRLSVVSFSDKGRRVTPLTRMSDAGKTSAKLAVCSLLAGGNTNIYKGLKKAAKVLDGRRHKNAVASVILLSDGQDTTYLQHRIYQNLVPHSLRNDDGGRSTAPVHTFGFGADHDPTAMHAVAELTGGTYSFIENQAVVQDAFAQCITRSLILSVVAQEAWIGITCAHPEVRVRAVKSGRYESRVLAYGRAAAVDVGELYADEERRFLLLVDVPRVGDDLTVSATRLIKVSCTYKDTATGKSMEVATMDAVVQRPAEVTVEEPSMEVKMERFRVEATEDIAAARAAAERGDHAEAARILDRRQKAREVREKQRSPAPATMPDSASIFAWSFYLVCFVAVVMCVCIDYLLRV